MIVYKIVHIIRHVIPDGRLCTVTADDDLMIYAHRFGHIHPLLVHEMNEISRQVVEAGTFALDPTRIGREGSIQAMLILTDALPDGRVMGLNLRAPDEGKPLWFEVPVRRGCIDLALLRELNEEVLPAGCGALIPLGPSGVTSRRP